MGPGPLGRTPGFAPPLSGVRHSTGSARETGRGGLPEGRPEGKALPRDAPAATALGGGRGGVQRRPRPAASGLRSHRRRRRLLLSPPSLPRLVRGRQGRPPPPRLLPPPAALPRPAASREVPVLSAIVARSRPLSSSPQTNMAPADPRKGTRQGRDRPPPPPPPLPPHHVTPPRAAPWGL